VHAADRVRTAHGAGVLTEAEISQGTKVLKPALMVALVEALRMDQCLVFCRTNVDCDNLEVGTHRSCVYVCVYVVCVLCVCCVCVCVCACWYLHPCMRASLVLSLCLQSSHRCIMIVCEWFCLSHRLCCIHDVAEIFDCSRGRPWFHGQS
jgi:hypothetical protein